MDTAMEPTEKTKQHIGEACMAWAHLEIVTEFAIWGILKLNMVHGPLVTWRLDMKMRWAMLLEQAAKHIPDELPFLKKMNKDVTICTRDRNIIVHGLIFYMAEQKDPTKLDALWSVFRGADAGKKFPVKEVSARLIRDNIQLLGSRMDEFNARMGYHGTSLVAGPGETDWPKPIS